MAEVISSFVPARPGPSQPRAIQPRPNSHTPTSHLVTVNVSAISNPNGNRNAQHNLHTFSPVEQNGSFACDRVLKSGIVHKRTRKTKKWKKVFLVLRPNLLSIYPDEQEIKLHRQVNLSDLTAVAYLKKPKREHVFGIFSPSKNYHLQARSDDDAHDWVELIRREARIEEEEEEMFLRSPGGRTNGAYQGFERQPPSSRQEVARQRSHEDRIGSSSPEPIDIPPRRSTTTRDGIRIPPIDNRSSQQNLDYSGTSFSDFSDVAGGLPAYRGSSISLSHFDRPQITPENNHPYSLSMARNDGSSSTARHASQLSGLDLTGTNPSSTPGEDNDERVVWHGYLYCLKSKGGVRQWKKIWAVLRPKKLAFYKNEEEYSPTLLLPMSSLLSAVEIDPISKSKPHCLQIIAEDRSFRLCAPSDDALAKWLGALKSQLAKKRAAEAKKEAVRGQGRGAAVASGIAAAGAGPGGAAATMTMAGQASSSGLR
ncbi:MAG: hypothetical protein M1817_005697 [Caeruleum heppii]|nr:MAG: hypothetical protein M1817_005697 [Caeruleum heppii]